MRRCCTTAKRPPQTYGNTRSWNCSWDDDRGCRPGGSGDPAAGLSLVATPLPFLLTDLKAAYIIAFAVLGYRWSLAPELRGVRAAIAAGREPAEREATVIRVKDGDPMPGRGVVLEVADPAPCVSSSPPATGYGVMLPVPGAYSHVYSGGSVAVPGDVRSRTIEWRYGISDFRTGQSRTLRPGRNEPCPCGSGRKVKRCHGAPEAVRAGGGRR